MRRALLFSAAITLIAAAPASSQQCLHGPDETAEQKARRMQALTATRNVNNIQANRPAAAGRKYLRHEELAAARFAEKHTSPAFKALNLTAGEDIIPGWRLTLTVSDDNYWFMVKDHTDPCGFAYISNRDGLIYSAEPIR